MMHNLPAPTLLSSAVDGLAAHGFITLANFLDRQAIDALVKRSQVLQQAGQLTLASTGKQTKLDQSIRGDTTCWLDLNSLDPAEQVYLASMQQLKVALNQGLYLGLESLECHFAHYPVGAFYKKHLDQFKNTPRLQGAPRQVSSILYLNQTWQTGDGGELRIYLDEHDPTRTLDIAPIGGTLVLFMSSRFYHEVLPAKRARLSLTGWFKTRENLVF